jgi:aldehyde dehydrogenase (NAD+)
LKRGIFSISINYRDIAINGMFDDQQAPFGGFKNSGVGLEFGIEAFLQPRAILE